MTKILEAKNITTGYGRKIVCNGLDLTLEAGTINLIVGANGCGKSTLFRVLSGLKKVRNGKVYLEGKEADLKKIQRFSGYVPQNNPLAEELSVWNNLQLWYQDKKELSGQLETGVLKYLGIDAYVKKKVGQLSGGMARRVSIGCAMADNPRLLILDEPGSALDLECKEILQNWMKKYVENGGCVLMSTHDESDLEHADNIYVMKNGKLEKVDGTISRKELISKY